MKRVFWPMRFVGLAGLILVCEGIITACSSPSAPPASSAPPAAISGSIRLVFQARKESHKSGSWTGIALEQERKVVENRAHLLNAQSLQVKAEKPDRIIVEVHGAPHVDQAALKLQAEVNLQFYWLQQLGNENGSRIPVWRVKVLPGAAGTSGESLLVETVTDKPVAPDLLDHQLFSQKPIISNKDLLPKCHASMLSGGYPVIEFDLNKEGSEAFKAFTRHHIGEHLGIFLDKKLLTAPTVNGVIKGKGIIEGNFTLESAQALAEQLNAGALPVPLMLVETVPLDH